MRDQYITKRYVKETFARLKGLCQGPGERAFLESRQKLVEASITVEARKYLFAETFRLIKHPRHWPLHNTKTKLL